MLVLSRNIGERIVIGDGVIVAVLAVRGRQVKLGIDAPASVRIRREELPVLTAGAGNDREQAQGPEHPRREAKPDEDDERRAGSGAAPAATRAGMRRDG